MKQQVLVEGDFSKSKKIEFSMNKIGLFPPFQESHFLFSLFLKLLKTCFFFFKQFHCQFVLTHKANEFWFNNSTEKIPVLPHSKCPKIRFNYFKRRCLKYGKRQGLANSKFSPQNRRKTVSPENRSRVKRGGNTNFLFFSYSYFILFFQNPGGQSKQKRM